MTTQFTLAAKDNIEKYELIATHFFYKILKINYHEGFYSDESWLSDCEDCLLDDTILNNIANIYAQTDKIGLTYTTSSHLYNQIKRNYLFDIINKKIQAEYSITIHKTTIPFVTIFKQILDKNGTKKYLNTIEKEIDNFVYPKIEDYISPPINRKNIKPYSKLSPLRLKRLSLVSINTIFISRYFKIKMKEAFKITNARMDKKFGLYEP